MRTSRYIRPIHVSEFAALFIKVYLMEEIGRLTIAQEEAQDRLDRDDWAMLTVKLLTLGEHLRDIEAGLRVLGPAPREVMEEYARAIHCEGMSLPRSRANARKWDAHQREVRKERREHVVKVRAEITAERAARKESPKGTWKRPEVVPTD